MMKLHLQENSIIDVWECPKYASGLILAEKLSENYFAIKITFNYLVLMIRRLVSLIKISKFFKPCQNHSDLPPWADFFLVFLVSVS